MRTTIKTLIILVISFVSYPIVGYAQTETVLDAKEILARCKSEGAVNIVNELTSSEMQKDWIRLTEYVETGDTAWIEASACLMPGTLESYSASDWIFLKLAWLEALTKNPTAMLEIEYQGVALEDTCELPHIEPEEDFLVQYVKDTLAALDKVDAPHLQEGKQRCMRMMKAAFDDPDRCKLINEIWHCPTKE